MQSGNQNKGWEVLLGATPVRMANGFEWNTSFTWARNRGKVVELSSNLQTVTLTSAWGMTVEARKGEDYGVIRGIPYERDSATAVMYCFLNVTSAAALAFAGADARDIAAALEEQSAKALMQTVLGHDPAATRRFFRSFGSCSFREPAEELARILADLEVGTTM